MFYEFTTHQQMIIMIHDSYVSGHVFAEYSVLVKSRNYVDLEQQISSSSCHTWDYTW